MDIESQSSSQFKATKYFEE